MSRSPPLFRSTPRSSTLSQNRRAMDLTRCHFARSFGGETLSDRIAVLFSKMWTRFAHQVLRGRFIPTRKRWLAPCRSPIQAESLRSGSFCPATPSPMKPPPVVFHPRVPHDRSLQAIAAAGGLGRKSFRRLHRVPEINDLAHGVAAFGDGLPPQSRAVEGEVDRCLRHRHEGVRLQSRLPK